MGNQLLLQIASLQLDEYLLGASKLQTEAGHLKRNVFSVDFGLQTSKQVYTGCQLT